MRDILCASFRCRNAWPVAHVLMFPVPPKSFFPSGLNFPFNPTASEAELVLVLPTYSRSSLHFVHFHRPAHMLQATPVAVCILEHPPSGARPVFYSGVDFVACDCVFHVLQAGPTAVPVEHLVVELFLGGLVGLLAVETELIADAEADSAVGFAEGDGAFGAFLEKVLWNSGYSKGDGGHGWKIPWSVSDVVYLTLAEAYHLVILPMPGVLVAAARVAVAAAARMGAAARFTSGTRGWATVDDSRR